MDADWTFPTQHDDLDIGADQDATNINFLEEQDALDAMLWEGLSVPPNDPWPDSQDTMDVGTNCHMDLGCVCDFPPLYCDQHGAYGDMSIEDDLSPPFFDLEQTIASLADAPDSSEFVLGRLALTEENLVGQDLSQSSLGTGHADSIVSTNHQSSQAQGHQDPQLSSKALGKQPLRRSRIYSKHKRILEAHFSSNPYPNDDELEKLRERTSLTAKCIKTWFVNTRHRTARRHPQVAPSPRETGERQMPETPSQAYTSVSAESLKELDRMSPARSTNSLERYLAIPLTEEAIPYDAFRSLSQTCATVRGDSETESLAKELEHDAMTVRRLKAELKALRLAQARMLALAPQPGTGVAGRTTGSVAGSDSSMNSGNSLGSWASQNSVGSRGSRRGRKSWVRTTNPFTPTTPPPHTNYNKSATTSASKCAWYCTWPSCNKSFRYRYEWDRHEAAVHHWPYRWVCNLGEDNSPAHKHAESRIFYREDQLIAHMKGAHRGAAANKYSASKLKQDNPNFDATSLKCGFCQQHLHNWEERQDHIAAHLSEGTPKSEWLC